jgi:hypothetical protein
MFYSAPCKKQAEDPEEREREKSTERREREGRKYSRIIGESEKSWEKWTALYCWWEAGRESFC